MHPAGAETAPEEAPVEAEGGAPPRDFTQPMMAVVDDEEGVQPDEAAAAARSFHPLRASPSPARECSRRGGSSPLPPRSRSPAAPAPGYETERTMAVPIHRLAEMPAPGEGPIDRAGPRPQELPPASPSRPPSPWHRRCSFRPRHLPSRSSRHGPQQLRSRGPLRHGQGPGDRGTAAPASDSRWVVPSTLGDPHPCQSRRPRSQAAELQEPVLEPGPTTPPPLPEVSPVTGKAAEWQQPPPGGASAACGRSWVVLAVLLLGGGGVAFLWWQSQQAEQEARRRHVPPTPRPPTPVPTETPKQPPAVLAQIRAFEEALAAGDLKAAQQSLETITPGDEQQLPPADLDAPAAPP